jgi:predicted ArsR family transcriptional regulator
MHGFAQLGLCYRRGMQGASPVDPLAMLAALDEPVRRRLYRFVRRGGRPVTREEAAAAVGISRKLAAFHLDRLVAVGLLAAAYEPPAGRPRRVGRTPKVYRPSDAELQVTIPERRYDLLAELLLDTLRQQDPARVAPAAGDLARDKGARLGARAGERRGLRRPGAERTLVAACQELDRLGFDSVRAPDGAVTLRNCPFKPLAQRAPELVCAINHAFVDGLVRGLGNQRVQVLLLPRPDGCCVELRPGSPA